MITPLHADETTFRAHSALALERVGLLAALLAVVALVFSGPGAGSLAYPWVLLAVGVLAGLAVFTLRLAQRWDAEWLVYASQAAAVGAYLYHQHARPLPEGINALLLVLL